MQKLEEHLTAANTAGGKKEDFKCRICKSRLYHLIIQSNKLLYCIDPKGTKKVKDVHDNLNLRLFL